jgi:hypothetical protein
MLALLIAISPVHKAASHTQQGFYVVFSWLDN